MFKYNENNIYDRYGFKSDNKYAQRPYFTGDYKIVDETVKIPVMRCNSFNDKLSYNLVLKTFLGYIPVEKVNSFMDLLNVFNYVDDETQWVKKINTNEISNIRSEKILKLSKNMGNHWRR